jgi:glutathione S-transferase
MSITLYDLEPSPHARKVRLLAAELGIPLNKIARDPRIGETRKGEFLAMNPNGRIPTLEEDGFVLWESPAILKYLAAKHPDRGLAGTDAKSQALIDQWMCWWIGGAEAAIETLNWERIIKPFVLKQPGNDAAIIADAQSRLKRFLPVLDRQLDGRDYVVGPLSVADFLIAPRLDTPPAMLGFDTNGYANIEAWLARLRAKPYWQQA